jgi:hypothetical protein
MSDYENGYKQGLEDAHRCEMRHARLDELEAENRALHSQVAQLEEVRLVHKVLIVELQARITALEAELRKALA